MTALFIPLDTLFAYVNLLNVEELASKLMLRSEFVPQCKESMSFWFMVCRIENFQ
jgi:hypothetical protein